jgi:hypothetical protein
MASNPQCVILFIICSLKSGAFGSIMAKKPKSVLIGTSLLIMVILLIAFMKRYSSPDPSTVRRVFRCIWSPTSEELFVWIEANDPRQSWTDCYTLNAAENPKKKWTAQGYLARTNVEGKYFGYRRDKHRDQELLLGEPSYLSGAPRITYAKEYSKKCAFMGLAVSESSEQFVSLGTRWFDGENGEVALWTLNYDDSNPPQSRFTLLDKIANRPLVFLLSKSVNNNSVLAFGQLGNFKPYVFRVFNNKLMEIVPMAGFAELEMSHAVSYSIAGDISIDQRFVVIAGRFTVSPKRTPFIAINIWDVHDGKLAYSWNCDTDGSLAEIDVCFSKDREVTFGADGRVIQITIEDLIGGSAEFKQRETSWSYPTGNCLLCRPLTDERCLVVWQRPEEKSYCVTIADANDAEK